MDLPNPGIEPRSTTLQAGFFTIWVTRQAQQYQSQQPIPSPGDLPHPGIELRSPTLQENPLPAEPPGKPYLTLVLYILNFVLNCSWFAILSWFQVYSIVIQNFYRLYSVSSCYEILALFPMLCSVSLWLIYCIHVLSLSEYNTPVLPLPFLLHIVNHWFVLFICELVSILLYSFFCFIFRFHE